jgi:hypothetical protein
VIESFRIKLFYGAALAFIAMNMLFIANEIYWFMALPVALVVVLLFFLFP